MEKFALPLIEVEINLMKSVLPLVEEEKVKESTPSREIYAKFENKGIFLSDVSIIFSRSSN